MCPILDSSEAADIQLVWDANVEPEVVGYKVYHGCSLFYDRNKFNFDYHFVVYDVGNITTCKIDILNGCGINFFAVTAYDSDAHESAYSNYVYYLQPGALYNVPPASGATISLTSVR